MARVSWAAMVGFLVSSDVAGELFGGEESLGQRMQAVAETPIVVVLLAPMRPFAELVLAETLVQFLTWLAVDVALLVLVFELCAYSAGELREATLTTSSALDLKSARGRISPSMSWLDADPSPPNVSVTIRSSSPNVSR